MGLGYILDPIGHVTNLVKEWSPRKCCTEKIYERSLVRHLRSKLKGKDVVPQYCSGRSRGDIVVNGKILIEIKANLDSTGKLDTLIGQLDRYEREWKKYVYVIVVLCGKHDSNLVSQLEKSMERRLSVGDYMAAMTLQSPRLTLVVK